MFFLKHLKQLSSYVILILLFASCSEKEPKRKTIAEVNDVKLYEEELNFFLNSLKYNNKNRDEFIRQWVETEVLFQKAREEGILDSANYKLIIEDAKRELAVALLSKKILNEAKYNVSESDLMEHFNKYYNDFRINSDAYVLGIIKFKELKTASDVRMQLLNNNWNNVVESLKKNKNVVVSPIQFMYNYQVQPAVLNKYISGMLPLELSVVIGTESGYYYVVKLLKKYNKYDIPDYEYIKPIIKERIIAIKNKIKLKTYIIETQNNYDIKINR